MQQLINPCVVFADAKVTRLKPQRFAHIEKGVKHQLLGHHAQQTPRLCGLGLHIAALNLGDSGGGTGQTRQDADQGGFAGTVGSEQAKELAFLDLQAHPVKGLQGTARGLKCFGYGVERNGGHVG